MGAAVCPERSSLVACLGDRTASAERNRARVRGTFPERSGRRFGIPTDCASIVPGTSTVFVFLILPLLLAVGRIRGDDTVQSQIDDQIAVMVHSVFKYF
jgi:hypothetical protein